MILEIDVGRQYTKYNIIQSHFNSLVWERFLSRQLDTMQEKCSVIQLMKKIHDFPHPKQQSMGFI